MKELYSIAKKAKEALRAIDGNKEYPSFYLLDRLEKASRSNPGDQLISNMRDVVRKMSSNNEFISRDVIGKIYDDMYGLSGGVTSFRDVLGDLLPSRDSMAGSNKSYARNRVDGTAGSDINAGEGLEDLTEAFSSLFSLSSAPTPGLYGDDLLRKAERVTLSQLKSVGFEPQTVKSVKNNGHYVLCVASYNENNLKQVNVSIPVRVDGGSVSIPDSIISCGEVVPLNKDNLYLHIKDVANHKDRVGVSKFSSERTISSYREDPVVVPASLEKYADLESDLVSASSIFSRDEIVLANRVVSAELASMGVNNPQVRVSSSNSKEIIFNANISTGARSAVVGIPVEIHNGRPILPSMFASGASVYAFDDAGFRKFMSDMLSKDKSEEFSRDGGPMSKMSYHELMDSMLKGVSTKDYKLAEDALIVIQSNYTSGHYKSALDKFSMMLKSLSQDEDRNAAVEAALKRGDLIIVQTSVEPYCPKLGLTLRSIDFDSKGRPVPRGRTERNANLRDSGAAMCTSKIIIS